MTATLEQQLCDLASQQKLQDVYDQISSGKSLNGRTLNKGIQDEALAQKMYKLAIVAAERLSSVIEVLCVEGADDRIPDLVEGAKIQWPLPFLIEAIVKKKPELAKRVNEISGFPIKQLSLQIRFINQIEELKLNPKDDQAFGQLMELADVWKAHGISGCDEPIIAQKLREFLISRKRFVLLVKFFNFFDLAHRQQFTEVVIEKSLKQEEYDQALEIANAYMQRSFFRVIVDHIDRLQEPKPDAVRVNSLAKTRLNTNG